MALSAHAAALFLIAALPISLFVAWSDLSRMKIPNVAVGALALAYAVLGLIALPFDAYLWGWAQLGIVLVIGIVLNAVGAVGAGDAKFAAAAAPMIAPGDVRQLLVLFSVCLLAGYVTHRAAKFSPLRRAVPQWESWTSGRRFPMGFPLGMTLVFYLIAALLQG